MVTLKINNGNNSSYLFNDSLMDEITTQDVYEDFSKKMFDFKN